MVEHLAWVIRRQWYIRPLIDSSRREGYMIDLRLSVILQSRFKMGLCHQRLWHAINTIMINIAVIWLFALKSIQNCVPCFVPCLNFVEIPLVEYRWAQNYFCFELRLGYKNCGIVPCHETSFRSTESVKIWFLQTLRKKQRQMICCVWLLLLLWIKKRN